jgi:flagellar biosynthesis chaperone FliJ
MHGFDAQCSCHENPYIVESTGSGPMGLLWRLQATTKDIKSKLDKRKYQRTLILTDLNANKKYREEYYEAVQKEMKKGISAYEKKKYEEDKRVVDRRVQYWEGKLKQFDKRIQDLEAMLARAEAKAAAKAAAKADAGSK